MCFSDFTCLRILSLPAGPLSLALGTPTLREPFWHLEFRVLSEAFRGSCCTGQKPVEHRGKARSLAEML